MRKAVVLGDDARVRSAKDTCYARKGDRLRFEAMCRMRKAMRYDAQSDKDQGATKAVVPLVVVVDDVVELCCLAVRGVWMRRRV